MDATVLVFATIVPTLIEEDFGESSKEEVEKVLRMGCRLLPLGSHIREGIARGWGMTSEKIKDLDDDAVVSLGLKSIKEEVVADAFLSHAKIIDAYFKTLFEFSELIKKI